MKHRIIIKNYTGKTQNDGVFYGNCTTAIIEKELNRIYKRLIDGELKSAIVIYPDTRQYFTFTSNACRSEFGRLSDDEYKTFVLERYFNQ